MTSTQLFLTEYETRPTVRLTPAQRDRLRQLAPSVAMSPAIGVEGEYDLTPAAYVGSLRLDAELELVIRPKLPIERVMFLIGYAMGIGRWLSERTSLTSAESLVEAIVPAFVHRLRQALERGVLQGYREREEALLTVRGRWRIGDQVGRRFGIAPPVEVTYDDFTEDIEANRLLRAAIHRLLRLHFRDERWRWALRALESRLDGVQLVDYDPHRVPEVAFDRRSEHYRAVIGLARLILANSSLDLKPGRVEASAFLIDMNRVFEDFVVVALREALGVSERTLVQGAAGRGLYLDVAERVRLRPDISMWVGNVCTFVGDVKYKRVVPQEYQHADLYQLTAYAIGTRLPRAMLIYAAGKLGEDAHEVVHLGKQLIVFPLDLTVTPDELLGQVARIAMRIARPQHRVMQG